MRLRRFHMRSLNIRDKIMLSLLAVSLFAIASISVVSLGVSRSIIMENSEQMAASIVSQVAVNLDERVKVFEETTYSILQQSAVRRMIGDGLAADFVDVQQREIHLSDAINISPVLYRYVQYALLENSEGQQYQYHKFRYSPAQSGEQIARKRETALEYVTKQSPLAWLEVDGDLVFARLLVDERSFEVQGLLLCTLLPNFFDLVESQEILSSENFLVTNRDEMLLYNPGFDTGEPVVRELLSDREVAYRLKTAFVRCGGSKTMVTSVRTPRRGWRIFCLIRTEELYRKDRVVILLGIVVAGAALGVSALLTVVIGKAITRNITRMESCMTSVESGDFKARMKPVSYDEVGRLGLRFNYMIGQMEELIDSVARERTSKQQAELQALQAQVNPHFLYNTLGSLKWLAKRKGEGELEAMLEALIALLKGSIRKATSFQTLAEETAYIQQYIRLQKMRYGDVFTAVYDMEEGVGEAVVPGFLLQPLVENSIYHGIDIAAGGGEIVIRAYKRERELVVEVEDNGAGFPEEKLQRILDEPKAYKGFNSIGVSLVRERLRACYGDACRFTIRSHVGRGTLVAIRMPLTTEYPGEDEETT